MRQKRNQRITTNDQESNRKPSPPKIYLANNSSLLQEFPRKGRSIPRDCQINMFQQKLSVPKRQTPRMLSKSGRSQYDSPNLVLQPMEVEYLSPAKQHSFLYEQKRVIKDASLVKSQRQDEEQLKNSDKSRINKLRKTNFHQSEVDPQCQVFEFNRELKALRVKRTESWEESDMQQFNLATYYMDNLRKYLKGLNLEGLYAQLYINHFVQQFHSLQLAKQFEKPGDKGGQLQNVKTLVLDLDETLIHCNEHPQMNSDFKVPIQMPNGQMYEAGISIRPFAQQFLQECSKHFDVVIFTASHQLYADKIIDKLDPTHKWVSTRLYREHCVQTQQGVHVKDLRVLNRDLRNVVLVDNAAYSYAFQIENGIPIIPYIDNVKDNELIGVIDYLKILLQMDDMRELNNKTFLLKKIQQCASIDEAMKLLLS